MTRPKWGLRRIGCAVLMCALLLGCGSEDPGQGDEGSPGESGGQPASSREGAPVAKVKVLADGTILLDDRRVTVDELKKAFAELQDRNGAVWYYREEAEGEPPPEAMAVIQAAVEARLPVRLSTKPDFSDSIGPDGG
jgi:hypothetical protein